MDVSLQLTMLLWISTDIYGYPCIDLLRILGPGFILGTSAERSNVESFFFKSCIGLFFRFTGNQFLPSVLMQYDFLDADGNIGAVKLGIRSHKTL